MSKVAGKNPKLCGLHGPMLRSTNDSDSVMPVNVKITKPLVVAWPPTTWTETWHKYNVTKKLKPKISLS